MFPGIAGQICGTILRNFITEFNFDDNHITLNKKERFDTDKYPCKVQMKVDSMGSYHIPVTVKYGDHVVKRRISLDLGGVFPLTLVTNNDFPLRGDEVKKHVANGASGPIYGYNTRVDYLQIGQYKLKDLETILTEDETGGDHTNQTIGLPLLMHFNMAFDYFNNVLYLVPNKRFKNQMP